MSAGTDFQRRVWAACRLIPAGRVVTYAEMARFLECASPRAIGQALRRNPDAPATPCHRIISSRLSPGGYSGEEAGPELDRKLGLLAAEGVRFRDGLLAEAERLWQFPRT
ncbi:MAG: hypothetical protein RL095_3105 [Verrucomicrobiota bacterium]|jgi:methylated-DNA-[protein]-cysteine S-methyltransferase